ncbi:hypothetical protein [Psychrobacillus phage Perkons]|nr:hypothetical protein [Psychrobacillus phage Perkons]
MENLRKVFTTSDGEEFEDINSAEHHELYSCKLNQRNVNVSNNEILDFENLEQVKGFVKEYYYSDTKLTFDYSDLIFPNTYVFVESPYEIIDNNGEGDVWLREETKLEIFTLDEFKESLTKIISEFE